MSSTHNRLQEVIRKQNIADFNKLKWELNEKLANLEAEKIPKVHLSSLNNMFIQILNKIKQFN
jgi:hypothetical protein